MKLWSIACAISARPSIPPVTTHGCDAAFNFVLSVVLIFSRSGRGATGSISRRDRAKTTRLHSVRLVDSGTSSAVGSSSLVCFGGLAVP